jgi:hypothetical protein
MPYISVSNMDKYILFNSELITVTHYKQTNKLKHNNFININYMCII